MFRRRSNCLHELARRSRHRLLVGDRPRDRGTARERGLDGYASARRLESLDGLEGCRTLQLDVTDDDSMRAAVERIEQEEGAAVAAATVGGYENGIGRILGGGPEAVAKAIERAVSARRPRTRYRVTASAGLFLTLRRLLPDRAWDALVGRTYPTP